MAKIGWLNVEPTSGSGDQVVNVSAGVYTGRSGRVTTLTVSSTGLENKTVKVTQKGKPVFVTGQNATMDKNVREITIMGTSNAKGLKFTEGSNAPVTGTDLLDIEMPYGYRLPGISNDGDPIPNGSAIGSDPGATAEYTWTMTFSTTINTTIKSRSAQITISDIENPSVNKIITIQQSAGDAYLTVSVSALELEYTGEAKPFTVNSNTSWQIS